METLVSFTHRISSSLISVRLPDLSCRSCVTYMTHARVTEQLGQIDEIRENIRLNK